MPDTDLSFSLKIALAPCDKQIVRHGLSYFNQACVAGGGDSRIKFFSPGREECCFGDCRAGATGAGFWPWPKRRATARL